MKKKIGRCIECGYKTKDENIDRFICKKCEKEMGKPMKFWVLVIGFILSIIAFYWYSERVFISYIFGILTGFSLMEITRRIVGGEKKNGH